MGKDRVAIATLRGQILSYIGQATLGHGHRLKAFDGRRHLHRGLRALSAGGLILVKSHDGNAEEGRVVLFRQVIGVHHPGVDQALAKLRILVRLLRHVLEDLE